MVIFHGPDVGPLPPDGDEGEALSDGWKAFRHYYRDLQQVCSRGLGRLLLLPGSPSYTPTGIAKVQ